MGSCFNISITFANVSMIMFPNVSVMIPIVRVSIVGLYCIDKAFVFILLQPLVVKNAT